MSIERETIDLEIKGHKFKVKTYATAREVNAIQSVYFEGSKVEIIGEQPKISEFNPSVQFNVSLVMIEQLVVEMDGEQTNIKDRCENLPDELFQELVQKLDSLVSKKKS